MALGKEPVIESNSPEEQPLPAQSSFEDTPIPAGYQDTPIVSKIPDEIMVAEVIEFETQELIPCPHCARTFLPERL